MKRIAALGALVVASVLALSACGSGAQPAGSATGSAAHQLLPRAIQDSGVLKVGGSSVVAPYLYKDGGKVVGFEKDLMDALGTALGVRVEFSDTGFPALIPGLQSRKIDVAMSDFTDAKDRQQAVDFVDYTRSYQILLVQKGNPKGLRAMDDLCGDTVAAAVGSLSERLATQQDGKCRQAGKPGVTVLKLEDAAAALMQVKTKRADALAIDYVVGRYVARTGQQSEAVGEPFYDQYHGAAVRKGNDQLRDALMSAFTELMRNGTYGRILAKWDLTKLSMPAPIVNAAKS